MKDLRRQGKNSMKVKQIIDELSHHEEILKKNPSHEELEKLTQKISQINLSKIEVENPEDLQKLQEKIQSITRLVKSMMENTLKQLQGLEKKSQAQTTYTKNQNLDDR